MPWRFDIRFRLFLAASLPAILTILFLLQGFAARQERMLTKTLHDQSLIIAHQVANAAEFPLFTGNISALQQLASGARAADRHVAAISIWGSDEKLLVSDGAPKHGHRLPVLSLEHPQVFDGLLLTWVPIQASVLADADIFLPTTPTAPRMGYVLVELELTVLQRQRESLWLWLGFAAGGGLLVAGILSVWIASSVTRPLAKISQVVSSLSQGQLQSRVRLDAAGVLTPLANDINLMAQELAENEATLLQRIQLATEELRKQKEAAERSAKVDPLTGLWNRRAFVQLAHIEMQRASSFGSDLTLVAVDLDHFKTVNDRYGHLIGDTVLENFGRLLAGQLRSVDVVARLGGEEFAVILPNTGLSGALNVAERIRASVANTPIMIGDTPLHYTASFGVAVYSPDQPDLEPWLNRADVALYRAKNQGRNRVEVDTNLQT